MAFWQRQGGMIVTSCFSRGFPLLLEWVSGLVLDNSCSLILVFIYFLYLGVYGRLDYGTRFLY